MVKGVIIGIALSMVMLELFSQNLVSRTDGTWAVGTNPAGPDCGCIPNGNGNILVYYNISITGPFTVNNNASLTVYASATLTINGNLTFNNGSTVTINEDAGLVVNGDFENKNNSDEVGFFGNIVITGDFTNGTGGSGSAIIEFGENATISIGGTCSNDGQVFDNSGFYTGCNSGPLPIKLLFFNGKLENGIVVLRWATTSEENFDRFIVERSSTGLNFQPIGEVAGVGRNIYDTETNYSFDDKAPVLGANYYRLKALDLDGAAEYFGVIVIKSTGTKQLAVYPNPSSGESISFQVNFNPSENDQILLINSLGQELLRVGVTSTQNQIVFDNKLSPGVYILEYLSQGFKGTSRVVVTH